MTEKKIFSSVEEVLCNTDRKQWATSSRVSYALLNCPRVRGMVRNFMMKRGVSLTMVDDVMSDMAVVMQMKMLDKLEKTSDVYFVIYRVAQLVVSNYGKKSIFTSRSEEVSISSLIDDGDDESGALERLSSDTVLDNQDEETEKRIDMESAKRRFTEKLNAVGWPSDIKRERKRMGRPPKRNPLQEASTVAAT